MSNTPQRLTLSGRYVAAVGALRQAHPHAGATLTTLQNGYAEAVSSFRAHHAEGLAQYRQLSSADQRAFVASVVDRVRASIEGARNAH